MAGRPKHWFTIDLDNIDDTVDEILKACKTPKVREGFQNLIIRLKDSLFERSDSYSQTDEFNSFQFIEMLSSVSENDVAFILDNIWLQLGAKQQMCSFSIRVFIIISIVIIIIIIVIIIIIIIVNIIIIIIVIMEPAGIRMVL